MLINILKIKKRYEKEMKNYSEQIDPAKKSDSDSDSSSEEEWSDDKKKSDSDSDSSSEEEWSDDKKKKKKRKDPAWKPKTPVRKSNAFMIFQKEQREILKKENPHWTLLYRARKLGENWRGMSDKEKQHYIELAEKDKERYEREQQEYKKK